MRHVAECPNCQREITTTIEAAQDGLQCAGCNTRFVPETLKQYADEPKPLPPIAPLPPEKKLTAAEHEAEQEERDRKIRLRELTGAGEVLWIWAIIFYLLTGGAVLFALFGEGSAPLIGAGCAGTFLFLALAMQLFSHLNHIRAALDRK